MKRLDFAIIVTIVAVIAIQIVGIRYTLYSSSKTQVSEVTDYSQAALVTEALPEIIFPESQDDYVVKQLAYIQVNDSCGHDYSGECLRVRSGPGLEYPVVASLREGTVLRVEEEKFFADDVVWYEIVFDEWLRYPERVETEWFVASEYVHLFYDDGTVLLEEDDPKTSKYIIVDRSDQKLYAYENDVLVKEYAVSTGKEFSPTPRGEFTVFRKTPSRYMQGPLPYLTVQDRYDLPGVPWNMYFTEQGAVIHGTYWHNKFGETQSHGCVNLAPEDAKELYHWSPIGIKVTVRS